MKDNITRSEKTRKASWIMVAMAVGLLLILGYGLRSRSGSLIGAPAPDFALSLFDGGELSLADLHGSVVVVNFWASWCPPCRDEAPVLEKIWREYENQGVIFVGVNFRDVPAKAMTFIEEFDITYPNGLDPYNRVSKAYGITGVPETFLIARDGHVVEHYIGPVSEADLRAALKEVLQE